MIKLIGIKDKLYEDGKELQKKKKEKYISDFCSEKEKREFSFIW